jgi:hypothetical protein
MDSTQCPPMDEWIKKLLFKDDIDTTENYSALKKEILPLMTV